MNKSASSQPPTLHKQNHTPYAGLGPPEGDPLSQLVQREQQTCSGVAGSFQGVVVHLYDQRPASLHLPDSWVGAFGKGDQENGHFVLSLECLGSERGFSFHMPVL